MIYPRTYAIAVAVALTALSSKAAEWYRLSWATWNADNPGCNMAFNCEAGFWYNVGFWTEGPVWDTDYTVYRNGALIASGKTKSPTYFTDYDAVPGVTNTYTIESWFRGMTATITGNFTCAYIYGANLGTGELAFGATGGTSAKKFVSATLYMQTATGKTNVPLSDAAVGSSASWISSSIVNGGIDVWVTANNADEEREGTVTLSCKGQKWQIKVTQAGNSTTAPKVPTGVSATDGSSTANVTVSWSKPSGAKSYTIYRNTSNASGSATAIASGVTSTSYTDGTANPGIQYWYWVKAVNSAGTSGFGGPDSGWRKASNDAFASAIALSGYSGSVSWGNYGATAQSGEPNHADGGDNSVWWTWTAPALGTMEISTLGSAFDTVLGVYTGTAVGSLTRVAANDDSAAGGTSTSRVVFETAGKGTVYRIAVAGFGGEAGAIALSWKFVAANAATLTGSSVNASSGAMHVAFKAKKGFTYQIQRCQTLGGTWTTVKTVTPSASGTVEADVSMPTSWTSGFVRILTEE